VLIVVTSSPRVAPGLLTLRAWEALRANPVLTGTPEHPLLPSLAEAGIAVETVTPDPQAIARRAAAGTVAWLAAQDDGDEEFLRAVRELGEPPAIEVVTGSYDPPGARLLDVVRVMDRLRTNCPWDRKQTHESLLPYLLEEAYEVTETIEEGDHGALREELGDLLLQVAFHARIAQERTPDEGGFDIDDVAEAIVTKLVRRHPHVFGGVTVSGADEVSDNWDAIKAAERAAKGEDASVLAGVPMGQPALSLALQLLSRAARAGVPEELADGVGSGLGARLFEQVRQARAEGLDPEAELRAAARAYRDRVRDWESPSA
jgi:MazG family protein